MEQTIYIVIDSTRRGKHSVIAVYGSLELATASIPQHVEDSIYFDSKEDDFHVIAKDIQS